jgi:YidC/Oxa1 family membrane protein insertase
LSFPKEKDKHSLIAYHAAEKSYTLEGDQLVVVLNAVVQPGINVTKTLTFKRDDYAVNVSYHIVNKTAAPWTNSYYMQLIKRIPESKKGFFSSRSLFGSGVAISSPEKPYTKIAFTKLMEEPIHQVVSDGWLAILQHYFISAWVPNKDALYRYYSRSLANGIIVAGLIGPKVEIQPNHSAQFSSTFYVGPKIATRLDQLSPKLWQTIDYGWCWFISLPLFKTLNFIDKYVGNWGWSIIILTILIKLVFHPLSATSYKSMAAMRKLQPKMTRLREQYVNDKQGMSRAMMELYRKEKVNPLGGCLPIVIQIPVFIALYYVLLESVELRQAPFIFWIHDLSIKDPYYVLPILMGISMYFQQKLNPPPPDPTQAKMMMFLPLIMTVFFLTFPAGLVLYWLANNLISVAQQYYIMKKYERGGYEKRKFGNKIT